MGLVVSGLEVRTSSCFTFFVDFISSVILPYLSILLYWLNFGNTHVFSANVHISTQA